MSALREAFVLPALFLTVVLLAALRPGAVPMIAPPGLFSLVLGVLLLGSLVRSGAVSPPQLVGPDRGALANTNGLVVMITLYAAAAQLLALLTPASGLPLFFVSVFLFVLLLNTWVSLPDRAHLLRSLMVILGAAFVLKFIVLASLADPSGSRLRRVILALFDTATLGGIAQDAQQPLAGYFAFAASVLFMAGVSALPVRRTPGTLTTSSYSNSA
jgi:hypothetical protein